jgi:hypothetical protein
LVFHTLNLFFKKPERGIPVAIYISGGNKMKLLQIAISLLLILSLIFAPVACSTQEKKIIYQTEDEVYYETEETLASKLIFPLEIGVELGDVNGLYLIILSSPIWVPAITIHHFLTKPTEISVEANEEENRNEKRK